VASTSYAPRRPEDGTLYQIVRDHFETFRAHAASLRDGEGLPRFVEQEFRDFLQCGWLAGGFARFRCGGCGLDRLVPFTCRGRGLCPSCGGGRMAERAAHLVDHVLSEGGGKWLTRPLLQTFAPSTPGTCECRGQTGLPTGTEKEVALNTRSIVIATLLAIAWRA
jgi:hypothetical protein